MDPDNDAYLESHFNEATRVNRTDADLKDKLTYLLHYFKFRIPYNSSKKLDAFGGHLQPLSQGGSQKVRNLGTLLHAQAATCWEKAALLHLALAEIGIPSKLEGGFKKKKTGYGHAWVVLGNGIVIDPTAKLIAWRSVYKAVYNITAAKEVASPKVTVSSEALLIALDEVARYRGSFWESATVERVNLKIDQVKRQEEREIVSREFDRLLSSFKV